ncbi:MAG: sialidase family protein [Planctomycetota bacterium]|nr:sialidase family protein [Planctomycetota bacterium]
MLNRAIQHALALGCLLVCIHPGLAQSTSGLALTANTDTNISRTNNDQFDVDVAIDRSNTQRVFFISDDDSTANGLFAGVSVDGGATFATRAIADGNDGLNVGNDQPVCTFDGFGNLFIAYREFNNPNATIHVAISVNGGATFAVLQSFGPDTDVERPAIAARNGDIWLAYRDNTNGGVVTRFTQSTALNQLTGNFSAAEALQGSANGTFADVAIGPNSEVYVSYQSPQTGTTGASILVNADTDGTDTGGFGAAAFVSSSNVGGQDNLPAQGNGTISSAPSIATDLSNGPHAGRVYVAYTEEQTDESNDTDVFIRFSTDKGATWSDAVRVNDTTTNSQFLPRVAVDASTGVVAVAWYDARNDAGNNQGADSNGVTNDDAEFFVSASIDGALSFLTNVQASAGASNAGTSGNATGYGDRIAIDFLNGRVLPVRPDNSTQLGNNPDRPNLDLALAPLDVAVTVGPLSITTADQVGGGEVFTATLSLNSAAPAGGLTVGLVGSSFILPSSVSFNEGVAAATFQATAPALTATANHTITASANNITVQRTISVILVDFKTFTISPTTITGSTTITGTVGLEVVVPTGELTITLTTDTPSLATIPSTVTIPTGSSSATFTGAIKGVTNLTNVTVSADLAGQTKTQTMRLEVGNSNSGSSSGSCFIATAAYGSPRRTELNHLRAFRDSRLFPSGPGHGFVQTYYANSPLAARQLKQSPLLRALTRSFLRPANAVFQGQSKTEN